MVRLSAAGLLGLAALSPLVDALPRVDKKIQAVSCSLRSYLAPLTQNSDRLVLRAPRPLRTTR